MRVDQTKLIELALKDPEASSAAIAKLTDSERESLLRQAGTGEVARQLAKGLTHHKPLDVKALKLAPGVTTFFARTSLPALGAFRLEFFQHKGNAWGRLILNSPIALLGPGYFRVRKERDIVLDFDEVPPQEAVPKGWPEVRPNGGGAAGFALAGLQIHLQGAAQGLMAGSVKRHGRDQGVIVSLLRAR